MKDNSVLEIINDPNLSITDTGTLVFDRFQFPDTGTYNCQDSDTTYILTIQCPANSDPNVLSNQCICSIGATSVIDSDSFKCNLCPYGAYKSQPGNHQCFSCPTSLVTEREGSISETSCVCPPGHGISSSMCVPCLADSYQDKYEEVPCIDCPEYSATPQSLGESDAEAFTSRGDCVCLYSPYNAGNNTCWPFFTTPTVTLVETDTTAVTISWNTESYTRADDGAYRGIIAGYHLEVLEDNELMYNVFTHKYTPIDYTPGEEYILVINSLSPDTTYIIAVNAYTKSTEFVDGPPGYLSITTDSLPLTTTTPPVTTTTKSPGIIGPTATTEPTTTTTATTISHTTNTHTDTTPETTVTTPKPAETPILPTATYTITKVQHTMIQATPKVIVRSDSTASSFLAVVVVLLALFIVVLVVLVVIRYWYGRNRRSRKLRYAKTSGTMKRVGPQPRFPVYSNAVYQNGDTSDTLI
ncbi:Signal peptide, CUB and EGF-like domain-containing protein 1 [Oopsacas minuta]|uniref:Signal peptide, CUB and EGF-like domain-containing protein 1 n=1 Tax=Oopsacas minuta TaxID=111878 RepID=A0AAV7KKZ4_9METZ|nr:Signal peptide, CUB and EGF-like domain-containing protein 1 [Oopsacas minuta]